MLLSITPRPELELYYWVEFILPDNTIYMQRMFQCPEPQYCSGALWYPKGGRASPARGRIHTEGWLATCSLCIGYQGFQNKQQYLPYSLLLQVSSLSYNWSTSSPLDQLQLSDVMYNGGPGVLLRTLCAHLHYGSIREWRRVLIARELEIYLIILPYSLIPR